jgi:hypothetical protein
LKKTNISAGFLLQNIEKLKQVFTERIDAMCEGLETYVARKHAVIFCACRCSSLVSHHLSCCTIRKLCHSALLRARA